jgi:hypothetical protein
MGIGGHRVDFHATLLEFCVVICEITELRGAHEGKVSRIEKHDRPLAVQSLFGHFDGGAVVESSGFEWLDDSINE